MFLSFRFLSCRKSAIYLEAVFHAPLCHVGQNCTHHQAKGAESSKFAAPVLFPSLFREAKFNHVNRRIFLFKDLYREIFFSKWDVMVQNIYPNSKLSPYHIKLIYEQNVHQSNLQETHVKICLLNYSAVLHPRARFCYSYPFG